jgi:hypothetical protein
MLTTTGDGGSVGTTTSNGATIDATLPGKPVAHIADEARCVALDPIPARKSPKAHVEVVNPEDDLACACRKCDVGIESCGAAPPSAGGSVAEGINLGVRPDYAQACADSEGQARHGTVSQPTDKQQWSLLKEYAT